MFLNVIVNLSKETKPQRRKERGRKEGNFFLLVSAEFVCVQKKKD